MQEHPNPIAAAKPASGRAAKGPAAFLGPEGTFTHQAAIRHFGAAARFLSCASIADVFEAVDRGQAEFGVVPVENSTEGAVSYTLDMFADSPARICAEIFLPIHHHLASSCELRALKTLYSHPQVFGQCRHWLRRHLPAVALVEAPSTSEAARRAAAEPACAGALASELAAQQCGLTIRERNIEDHPGNLTRFFVIGSHLPPPSGHDKTSLLFGIRDRVGALLDSLEPFRRNQVSLSFIESRPSRRRNWEYQFYVDILGHCDDPPVRAALAELAVICEFVKCLGSYPRATLPTAE
ncbi:MAG: prephenate dehydratase [Lentisphaeria bacterium]|jgi:chorismate mutase/prephenate dehydratase